MERKEAIEVIKKNWPDSSFTMLREALETLIPELKESEDERVRNAIINFLHEGNPFKNIKKETRQRWIAWLEKQGEQKPVKASYTTIVETGNGGINAVVKRDLSSDGCYVEQKPVNVIEFEAELYNHFGQVRDFTLGMRIAKYFYEMGVKAQVKQEGTNRNGDSQKIKSEFQKLYNEIDVCINSLVWARRLHDDTAETRAHEQMEKLMVATQQEISWMLDNGYAERERRKDEEI